jgi:hypothetical protein
MTPSAQDRLAKLLRMLSSNKYGEVLAATAAIERSLANKSLGIHSLANALCQPTPRAEAKAHWPGAETSDWHSVACECDAQGVTLNLREQKFVFDIVAWTWHARASGGGRGC